MESRPRIVAGRTHAVCAAPKGAVLGPNRRHSSGDYRWLVTPSTSLAPAGIFSTRFLPALFRRVQTSICAGDNVLDVVPIGKGRYAEAGRTTVDLAEIG